MDLKRASFAAVTACWMAWVAYFAIGRPPKVFPLVGDLSHPVGHAIIFGLLTLSLGLLFQHWSVWQVSLVALSGGAFLEVAQSLSDAQTELQDVIADAVGIAAAGLVLFLARRSRKNGRLGMAVTALAMAASAIAIPLLPDDADHGIELSCTIAQADRDAARGRIARFASTDTAPSASELVSQVARTNEVTVAAWFAPARLDQTGPARLVTLSNGIARDQVNVHLGLEGTSASVRFRTGCRLQIWVQVDDVITDTETHHLAATYSPGKILVYIDGRLVDETSVRPGDLGNWDPSYPYTVGNEATGGRPFDGVVFEAQVYDLALAAEEIAALAAAGPRE